MALGAPEVDYDFEENPRLQKLCEFVADAIGGNITPERVRRVIEIMNENRHLVHGVKSECNVEAVREKGILPLTPEGGYASYWTSGERVFAGETERGFTAYDTTFFHYGHSSYTLMTIALTNGAVLKRLGYQGEIPRDDYLTLHFPIPKEAFCLLRVELIQEGVSHITGREQGQFLEQKMFELLEDALVNGYQPGEEKKIRIRINSDGTIRSE